MLIWSLLHLPTVAASHRYSPSPLADSSITACKRPSQLIMTRFWWLNTSWEVERQIWTMIWGFSNSVLFEATCGRKSLLDACTSNEWQQSIRQFVSWWWHHQISMCSWIWGKTPPMVPLTGQDPNCWNVEGCKDDAFHKLWLVFECSYARVDPESLQDFDQARLIFLSTNPSHSDLDPNDHTIAIHNTFLLRSFVVLKQF